MSDLLSQDSGIIVVIFIATGLSEYTCSGCPFPPYEINSLNHEEGRNGNIYVAISIYRKITRGSDVGRSYNWTWSWHINQGLGSRPNDHNLGLNPKTMD